ncbi:rhomboid family intramembrane serine protease [Marinomonas sp.]|nr:rhomboid family intramembrane serine protease [Marinomonas sp.]MDB4837094.1 rhomboid family intramembrane serine protease [Marinomonas sp.]
MYPVYRFLETEDPSLLTKALWRHKIAHQVIFNDGHNELWLKDADQFTVVEEFIAQWKQDPNTLSNVSISAMKTPQNKRLINHFFSHPFRTPVTLLLVLISIIITLFTELGDDLTKVGYFTISAIEIFAGQIHTYGLSDVLSTGEYWRFLTPAFLHFSVIHLVFNALWVWDIGRKLEIVLGTSAWLIGVLIVAVTSNVLQYQITGYPLFGGLSGVVYGIIGFAWLLPMFNKKVPLIISKPLAVFFIVWLGIGYTSIPELLGLGSIANTAHTIGLVTGLLLACIYGLTVKLMARFTR